MPYISATQYAALDWPNPSTCPRRPPGLDEARLQIPLTLRGIDTAFGAMGQGFANYDWPVPRPAPFALDLRTWIQRRLLTLVRRDQFFGAPGQPPVFLPMLPPSGPSYPTSLRTFLQRAQLLLSGADSIPFRQSDWPVPPPVPRISLLRIWLDRLPLVFRPFRRMLNWRVGSRSSGRQ